MLNKEMLLTGNAYAPYTHMVTVAKSSSGTDKGYVKNTHAPANEYGSISPLTLTVYEDTWEILEVFSSASQTTIRINGFFADYQQAYLGRSDTRTAYGHPGSGGEEFGEAIWNSAIFTDADVGKRIPVWISFTPPHIKKMLRILLWEGARC